MPPPFQFNLQNTDGLARAGILHTAHGPIETPIFMPVGTRGTVKGVHQRELSDDIQAQIILGNTYHLYLRPGLEVIEAAGGLHPFIGWKGPILTDSGGYQVYSLGQIRKIEEKGVTFKSHIDGTSFQFTPENVIATQRSIGADITMAFDECPPYPCEKTYAEKSMNLTHRWLDRCISAHAGLEFRYGHPQALFPIVQGSVFDDLRVQSAEYVAEKGAPGNAIGGLSVGEPVEDMYRLTELVCKILPKDKPRYLMGVGTPANILHCIARGVDMFDCVMPTRNGRNGMIFTTEGIVNIKNSKYRMDFSPLNPQPISFIDIHYTKAYVRHLLNMDERLGGMIASIANLRFYLWLVGEARRHILADTFSSWLPTTLEKITRRL